MESYLLWGRKTNCAPRQTASHQLGVDYFLITERRVISFFVSPLLHFHYINHSSKTIQSSSASLTTTLSETCMIIISH